MPATLIAFAAAALSVVGAIVVVARTDDAWTVVFAVLMLIVLLAIVLWAVELDIRPPRVIARQGRRSARPGIPQTWSGPPAHRRVLLVASEPVGKAALSPILAGDGAETAVLVVAPALTSSGLRYWVSDSDEAIEHAQNVEAETLRMLEDENVATSGHVGSADPVVAIEDALRFFDADRIVLALHTRRRRRYRERDLRVEVERRFRRPVLVLEPRDS